MRVLFFATIRKFTGATEIVWDAGPATLGELLSALTTRYGEAFGRWVLAGEELGGAIIITVNGRDARHLAGARTALKPDDTIAIFPAIAGGVPAPGAGDAP